MTLEQILEAQKARPFRPYTLHLDDGRAFAVPHPEFLVHHPTGRTIIHFYGRNGFNIIDLRHVNSLEFAPDEGQSAA